MGVGVARWATGIIAGFGATGISPAGDVEVAAGVYSEYETERNAGSAKYEKANTTPTAITIAARYDSASDLIDLLVFLSVLMISA